MDVGLRFGKGCNMGLTERRGTMREMGRMEERMVKGRSESRHVQRPWNGGTVREPHGDREEMVGNR